MRAQTGPHPHRTPVGRILSHAIAGRWSALRRALIGAVRHGLYGAARQPCTIPTVDSEGTDVPAHARINTRTILRPRWTSTWSLMSSPGVVLLGLVLQMSARWPRLEESSPHGWCGCRRPCWPSVGGHVSLYVVGGSCWVGSSGAAGSAGGLGSAGDCPLTTLTNQPSVVRTWSRAASYASVG